MSLFFIGLFGIPFIIMAQKSASRVPRPLKVFNENDPALMAMQQNAAMQNGGKPRTCDIVEVDIIRCNLLCLFATICSGGINYAGSQSPGPAVARSAIMAQPTLDASGIPRNSISFSGMSLNAHNECSSASQFSSCVNRFWRVVGLSLYLHCFTAYDCPDANASRRVSKLEMRHIQSGVQHGTYMTVDSPSYQPSSPGTAGLTPNVVDSPNLNARLVMHRGTPSNGGMVIRPRQASDH